MENTIPELSTPDMLNKQSLRISKGPHPKNLVAIDLFCGIGGLSYGLQSAGIQVAAGIDLDDSCQYAYEENVKADFLTMDIATVKGVLLKEKYWKDDKTIKVLVGCAPCQPFSTHANKNRDKEGSQKWNLLSEFGRLIEEVQPEIISMENVPNLSNQDIFQSFLSLLTQNGYSFSYSNVYCPDYGIPQKRRRLVLFASKYGDIRIIPKTHSPENYKSTWDTIGSLPPIESHEVCPHDLLHRTSKLSDINLKRIRASRPNGTWQDWEDDLKLNCHKKSSGHSYQAVYGRMSWEDPSPTITTQFYNFGTGRFGHPSQDRALTIREAALLQSFPSNYKFLEEGTEFFLRKLARHIGNAVPVDLGHVIGLSINTHIKTHQ